MLSQTGNANRKMSRVRRGTKELYNAYLNSDGLIPVLLVAELSGHM